LPLALTAGSVVSHAPTVVSFISAPFQVSVRLCRQLTTICIQMYTACRHHALRR
jgi:hypothetical protein